MFVCMNSSPEAGFKEWIRAEFQSVCRALEQFGRDNLDEISDEGFLI